MQVLSNATEESDNPDLRDRAYIYWRLLSTDPEAARDIVLAEKSIIQGELEHLPSEMSVGIHGTEMFVCCLSFR